MAMKVSAKFWREQDARYNLEGTRCLNCGSYFFPPRSVCPRCRRKGKIERYRFSGTGRVLTYSVVHQPNACLRSPYIIAIIELDEGVKVLSEVICGEDEIKTDLRVKAVFRKLGEDGEKGIIYYGTKFVPA
ncbi:MAG: Zn-ribbon domain-containing OB-fold protein [Canidatus Methanoxibalbensis ujae]|nr:Zn-ribbon domain-containing OB-fold protein [Candidatus Methanoxibalbensis ujae]